VLVGGGSVVLVGGGSVVLVGGGSVVLVGGGSVVLVGGGSVVLVGGGSVVLVGGGSSSAQSTRTSPALIELRCPLWIVLPAESRSSPAISTVTAACALVSVLSSTWCTVTVRSAVDTSGIP